MALATADKDGDPSVRMVLLKGHGRDGFVFYTNEDSHKGQDLAENPNAALLFHWKSLRRQVRIEGWVERVSDDQAERLFRDAIAGNRSWGPGLPTNRVRCRIAQRLKIATNR